jgi:hypothetical protein
MHHFDVEAKAPHIKKRCEATTLCLALVLNITVFSEKILASTSVLLRTKSVRLILIGKTIGLIT